MAREFSRKEFHALVWSKPMTHLAKEFGLSDVALHKVCRKHGIPTPPAGWWAKKAAGKDVAVTPLPPSPGLGLGRVTIASGELRDEPPTLAIARENARSLLEMPAISTAAPHSIVERTLAKLRKAKPASDNNLVSVSGPKLIQASVAPTSVDRVEVFLTSIVPAIRAIGADIVPGENTTILSCEGEKIAFTIKEGLRREPHVLTAKEEADQKKEEARREQTYRANDWTPSYSWMRPLPEWDYHPNGQLAFEMERRYFRGTAPRRTFKDGKTQTLETLATDIAVGVAVMAAAMKEDRRIRDEEDRLREEATQRRLLDLRAKHVEERREKALEEILEEIGKLERLRHLVASLRRGRDQSVGRVREFLEFAERRLAERGEALTSAGLDRKFEAERLFGDDDDHGFNGYRYS